MKQRIAIEPSLTQVKQYLEGKGYNTVTLGSDDKKTDADAYVVTGLNSNVMGIADTETKSIVVDANGLTAEQVYQELQNRLH